MQWVPALKAVIAVETTCAAVVWGIFGGVEIARSSTTPRPFVVEHPAPAGLSALEGSAGGARLPAAVDQPAQLPPPPTAPVTTTTVTAASPTTGLPPATTLPPAPTTTATTVPADTTTTTVSPPTTSSPPSTSGPSQSGQ